MYTLLLLALFSTAPGAYPELYPDAEDFLTAAGASGPILLQDGTSAAPGLGFILDTNTGLYRVGADTLGFTTGGGLRLKIDNNGIYGIPFYSEADGTSSAARFSWSSDTDLGLYRAGANQLGLAASAGVLLNGNLDMAGYDIENLDDLYSDVLAADTLPRSTLVLTQHPWAQSTTPVNYIGSNLLLGGSIGSSKVDFVAAGSGGNTVVITHNDSQVGAADTVTTYTSDAGGWTCSTETNAVCACNLYTIIIGAPVAGWTVQRTDATCSDGALFFQPDNTTHTMVLSETGATFTVTQQSNGLARMTSDADLNFNRLYMDYTNDPDTYIYSSGSDYLNLIAGGASVRLIEATDDRVDFSSFRLFSSTGALNLGANYDGGAAGATGSVSFGKDAANISFVVEGTSLFQDAFTVEGTLTTTGRRVITPGSQELSAAETLTITSSEMEIYSDGGSVSSTADPALSAGTANGEIVCVMGTSDVNRIQWHDESVNAGSTLELELNVSFDMGIGDRLCLRWYASGSKWYENGRWNN